MTLKSFSIPYAIAVSLTLFLASCGGGGSSSSGTTPVFQVPPPPAPTPAPPPPPPETAETTLSGTLMFERVPLSAVTNGLDYNNTFQLPIRSAPVDLLDSNGAVIDSTVSDDAGAYSFTVNTNAIVSVRVRAEIVQENVNFRVIDNTSSDAIYTLQGAAASVGAGPQSRDLIAGSGWTGTAYTQTRAAAPFALLDTVLSSVEDFMVFDTSTAFPEFDILWSVNNRPESGTVADGEIGTSSFTTVNGRPQIRILGLANNDTDEYDEHVVTHEFGHYLEDQLSRSDSLGGPHSIFSRLDPRVAFSEGWGNALSAILTGETIYRDSGGNSQANGFSFDVENNNLGNQGWYSEASVQSILYNLFDSNNDDVDQISLGLGPIFSTFTDDAYTQSDFFTTIYSFVDVLAAQSSAPDADALTVLLESEQIFGTGPDGANETNAGGLSTNLPVYSRSEVGAEPLTFCSVNDNGIFNRLGNRVFATLDLTNDAALDFRMERVSGPTARDPDFRIFSQGRLVARGISPDVDLETANISLSAGRYIISAADDRNLRLNDDDETGADSCYSFSVNGG